MFFTLNRVFQSLFLSKSKSWVLLRLALLRDRLFGRNEVIGHRGRKNSASPQGYPDPNRRNL